MEKFFCLDCLLVTYLDTHGRCQYCCSDAVTHPESYRVVPVLTVKEVAEIAELERMLSR